MPKLMMKIDDQQLNEETLQEGLSKIASNGEAMRFVKAMLNLMEGGDLGFWLSPRLARRVKAVDKEHQGDGSQSTGEIDEESFISFLQEGGSIEPKVRWEVESLPSNGGIYRILLEGGQDAKGIYDNPG